MMRQLLSYTLLTMGIVVLAGCDRARIGQTEHETKVVELDKSELTRVEIKIGAGELRVGGRLPQAHGG
jgi:hypothetical protein